MTFPLLIITCLRQKGVKSSKNSFSASFLLRDKEDKRCLGKKSLGNRQYRLNLLPCELEKKKRRIETGIENTSIYLLHCILSLLFIQVESITLSL